MEIQPKQVAQLAITVTIGLFLFFMVQALSVDIIDNIVEQDVATGAIPDVTIINYIIAVYSLVLVGALGMASIAIYKNRQAFISVILASVSGLGLMYALALAGAFSIGLKLEWSTFTIVPALFAALVLRDPGLYIGILASVCTAWLFVYNTILEVE